MEEFRHTVLECDLDDLVSGKICADRSYQQSLIVSTVPLRSTRLTVLAALANDVCLVGLLPVHGQTILVTVHGDGLEGQLVSSTEDADRDFSTIGDENLGHLHDGAVRSQAGVDGVGMLVGLAVVVRRTVVVLLVGHDGHKITGKGVVLASDGAVVAVLSPGYSPFRLVELLEEKRSEERREWSVGKMEESQSRRKM